MSLDFVIPIWDLFNSFMQSQSTHILRGLLVCSLGYRTQIHPLPFLADLETMVGSRTRSEPHISSFASPQRTLPSIPLEHQQTLRLQTVSLARRFALIAAHEELWKPWIPFDGEAQLICSDTSLSSLAQHFDLIRPHLMVVVR